MAAEPGVKYTLSPVSSWVGRPRASKSRTTVGGRLQGPIDDRGGNEHAPRVVDTRRRGR